MKKVVVNKKSKTINKLRYINKPNLEELIIDSNKKPVIPAVKDDKWLKKCLISDCKIVYVLYGNICTIASIVQQIKDAGKIALVHIDLIEGLSSKSICVDFLKKYTRTDGIISTRPQIIARANALGFISIQRFFLLDARNYDNVKKHVRENSPDIIEVMPAGLFKMISYVLEEIDTPLIASGLVLDHCDVSGAIKAGAFAVSTTNCDLW